MQNQISQHILNTLEIITKTWTKDTHGLFDYENQSLKIQQMSIRENQILIQRNRITSEVKVEREMEEEEGESGKEWSNLVRVVGGKQNEEMVYYVENEEGKEGQEGEGEIKNEEKMKSLGKKQDAYLVVNSLKNIDGSPKGHVLEIGERIKLGRSQYQIVQMRINNNLQISDRSQSKQTNYTQYIDTTDPIQQGATCRFCFQPQDILSDPHNFFFSPCRCCGTSKHIHIKCLQKWILIKIKKLVIGGTAYYQFNKLECESCKDKLSRIYIKNSHSYQLLKVQRPQQNYFILQQYTRQQDKKDLIVIKNISQLGINIGRDRNSQIRLQDGSVSRPHAKILIKNGKFVIFDMNSKFGTLIKLTKNYKIISNCKFQVGRTVIQFTPKKQKHIQIIQNNPQQSPSTSSNNHTIPQNPTN